MTWQRVFSVLKSRKFYLLIVLLAGLALLYLRYAPSLPTFTSEPGSVTVAAPPRKAERIVAKGKAVAPPPQIVVLDKEKLGVELKMERELKSEDFVLSAATIPAHTGPTTAVVTLSKEGEAKILTRREPIPFFAVKREFAVVGKYLFAGQNLAEIDLQAKPLRVGPVEVLAGAGVEVDRETNAFRGRGFVGFEYRF